VHVGVRPVQQPYLGLLQYLTPSVQFVLGVFVFGEPMPPERLAGFVLIWIALAAFTGENLYHLRKLRRQAVCLAPDATPYAARRS